MRQTKWSFDRAPRRWRVALAALYLAGARDRVPVAACCRTPPSTTRAPSGATSPSPSWAGSRCSPCATGCRRGRSSSVLFVGTLIVTRAVFYGEDPSGYYTFWYLWIGVYSFFFFGRAWGLAQMAAIAATYAWVLMELDAVAPVSRWMVTIGSILVAGLLIDVLAGHLQRETRAAATRAANLEAVGEVARHLATQSDPRAVGWAICSAALRATDASAAILWRPTPAGSELVATAAAGVNAEGTRLPFVTPSSGAIQAFTSAERRFDTLEAGPAAQELAPEAVGRRGALGAGAEGQGGGGRGAGRLLGRGLAGGGGRDRSAPCACWRSRPRSRSTAASCWAGSSRRRAPTT